LALATITQQGFLLLLLLLLAYGGFPIPFPLDKQKFFVEMLIFELFFFSKGIHYLIKKGMSAFVD